jgi:hypothetical protein
MSSRFGGETMTVGRTLTAGRPGAVADVSLLVQQLWDSDAPAYGCLTIAEPCRALQVGEAACGCCRHPVLPIHPAYQMINSIH